MISTRIIKGGTCYVELRGLIEQTEREHRQDATVVANLEDSAGISIAGGSNIDMPYVDGTPSTYRGLLSSGLTDSLSEGQLVIVRVTATLPDGRTMPFVEKVIVQDSGTPQ